MGRYIVADPAICHGKPTFIGTRVMVWQVLEMVSEGMDWDDIVRDWRNSVPKEAIAEAIELAKKAFVDHATEYPNDGGTHEHPRRKRARKPTTLA